MSQWTVPTVEFVLGPRFARHAKFTLPEGALLVELRLTRAEADVITRLVEANGQCVSHAALDEGSGGRRSNVIEVLIGRIRRKLAAAGAPPLIKTVRGSGYRFGVPQL